VDIDWRSLRKVGGTAEGIPRLIDEAVSDDAELRTRAREELFDELLHQGMLTDACVPAIALLTEYLKRTRTPKRAGLLRLTTEFTMGDPDRYLVPYSIHELFLEGPEAERQWGAKQAPLVRDCYAAGYATCEVARRLLWAGSAEEKVAAAHLLTFYPSYGKRLAPWMVRRLRLEDADIARAGLLVCLGYWALWRRWRRPPPEVRACLEDESAIVRASAAIALRGYGVLDEAVFAELARTMRLPQVTRFYWCGGRLGELATALLADGTPRSTQAIAESIESSNVDEDEHVERAMILTRRAFPKRTYIDGHQVIDMPALADLTEAQRIVLRVLAVMPDAGFSLPANLLQSNGLPSYQPDLRRYVGLSAPGPTDVLVAGTVDGERVKWPAHVWVRRMALGKISRDAVIDALVSHPSDDELIAMMVEGVGAYSLSMTGSLDWPTWVRFVPDVLARRRVSPAAVEDILDALLSEKDFGTYRVLALLGALARLAPELPAKYDAVVMTMKQSRVAQTLPDVLQSVEAAIPAARRPS
jgi:hypothetical protein